MNQFSCIDCGVDTSSANGIMEYYMVHNHIWLKVNPDSAGMLCIGCLENRLGRTLTGKDFTDARVNWHLQMYHSDRLTNRLKATVSRKVRRKKIVPVNPVKWDYLWSDGRDARIDYDDGERYFIDIRGSLITEIIPKNIAFHPHNPKRLRRKQLLT